jgi:hypothetical protein
MNYRRSPLTEPIGAVGLPIYAGYLRLDPNPYSQLYGRDAIRVYRDMRYNEPAAAAFLNVTTALLPTEPDVIPGGATDADQRAAEHIRQCLADLSPSFATTIRQMASILWAGWDIHEIVYKRTRQGFIGWQGFELRRQDSIQRWQMAASSGTISGWEQRPAPDFVLRTIPAERYIHIVADDSEGSPEGLSPLRGMYRHWYMTKQLELLMGISFERFGTGLPVFEIDEGVVLTERDQALLQDALLQLRQNEYAGAIMPAGVRFRFADSPGLDVENYIEIIRYLRLVMLSVLLADFIGLGTQQGGGAYALGKDKSELFLLSLNGTIQRITDAITEQAVTRLLRLPALRQQFGPLTAMPRVTLPPIKRYDLEQLSGFVKVLTRIGSFTPTIDDEIFFRKIGDLLDRTPADLTRDRADAQPDDPTTPADANGAPDDTPIPASEEDADETDDDAPIDPAVVD